MINGRIFKLLVLFAGVWCLLSGHFTALLLGLGLLSCSVCVFVFGRIKRENEWLRFRLNPVRVISYTCWLLKEIFKSNFSVMAAIVSGKNIAPEIFDVDTSRLGRQGQVIFANSITLTPGTVSVRIEEDSIRVHGLLSGAGKSFSDNEMHDRVCRLITGEKEN